MKKHQLIASAGMLALLSNIIVPSLAFGQDNENQTGNVTINCTAGTLSIANTPDTVNLGIASGADVTASASAQSVYDKLLNDDAELDDGNILAIEDTRSNNLDVCPAGTDKGFNVAVAISTPLTYNAVTIPSSNFRIITSNEFDRVTAACTLANDEQACYGVADGAGNHHDVVAAQIYDDEDNLLATVFDKFNTATSYTDQIAPGATESVPGGAARTNTLDSSVQILRTTTSHNQTIQTGVAIYGSIPGNTPPGAYTGTITYTLTTAP